MNNSFYVKFYSSIISFSSFSSLFWATLFMLENFSVIWWSLVDSSRILKSWLKLCGYEWNCHRCVSLQYQLRLHLIFNVFNDLIVLYRVNIMRKLLGIKLLINIEYEFKSCYWETILRWTSFYTCYFLGRELIFCACQEYTMEQAVQLGLYDGNIVINLLPSLE